MKAIRDYGLVVVTKDLAEAVEVANRFAPEHLELLVKDPKAMLAGIRNAGAIFLGHYTPEALGDYLAGPNHILPTGGTARFSSPLGVYDFVKRTSVLSFERKVAREIRKTCRGVCRDGRARRPREIHPGEAKAKKILTIQPIRLSYCSLSKPIGTPQERA